MPSRDLDSLLDDAREGLAYHLEGLRGGRLDSTAFQVGVAQDLITFHTAAYMLGADTEEIDDDQARQLKARIGGQIDYLNEFVDDLDTLSDAEIEARLSLYGKAVGSSYWDGWAGEDLECVPGSCPECYSNCRCELDRRDDGIYWVCQEDDRSCSACLERAQTWTPYNG